MTKATSSAICRIRQFRGEDDDGVPCLSYILFATEDDFHHEEACSQGFGKKRPFPFTVCMPEQWCTCKTPYL